MCMFGDIQQLMLNQTSKFYFQFSGISNLKDLKIMAKKMGSLVRKILSEVGRNEMLSWGYRIEK